MTETATHVAVADRYRNLAARFTELVEAVPEDRWDAPSPCQDWTALEVLEHVVATENDMLARMPFGSAVDTASTGPRAAWTAVRDNVQRALDDPETANHGYDGHFGPTTFAATVDQFYAFDLVVHAWDIARATGTKEFEAIPPNEVARLTGVVTSMGDSMRQPGVLGPAVPVPDDADEQTKLIGLLGRQP